MSTHTVHKQKKRQQQAVTVSQDENVHCLPCVVAGATAQIFLLRSPASARPSTWGRGELYRKLDPTIALFDFAPIPLLNTH